MVYYSGNYSDYLSQDARRSYTSRTIFFYRFTPLSAIASLSWVLTGLLRTFYCSLQIISGEQQPAILNASGSLKWICNYKGRD